MQGHKKVMNFREKKVISQLFPIVSSNPNNIYSHLVMAYTIRQFFLKPSIRSNYFVQVLSLDIARTTYLYPCISKYFQHAMFTADYK